MAPPGARLYRGGWGRQYVMSALACLIAGNHPAPRPDSRAPVPGVG